MRIFILATLILWPVSATLPMQPSFFKKFWEQRDVKEKKQLCYKIIALNKSSALGLTCRGWLMLNFSPSASVKFYTLAIKKNPSLIQSQILLINALAVARKFEEARDLSHEVLKKDHSFRTLFYSCKVEFALKEYRRAIEKCKKAASVFKGYEAFAIQALSQQEIKEYNASINNFTIAINLEPNDPYLYMWRGLSYKAKLNYKKAIEDYDKALSVKKHYVYFYNRSIALLESGKLDAAHKDAKKTLAMKPSYDKAYNLLGNIYNEQNKFNLALRYYDKAIKLNYRLESAYHNKGLLFLRQKRYQEALTMLTIVISFNPKDESAFLDRGKVFLKVGQKERACDDFLKAWKLGAYMSSEDASRCR